MSLFLPLIGIEVETTPGTFVTPDAADLIQMENVTLEFVNQEDTSTEQTGSIHRRGAIVLGRRARVTGRVKLRGPGGASPPAGGTVLGRILRGIGFTETISATAVPASPGTVTTGTTTTVTLPAGFSDTVDLYTGLPLVLTALGTGKTRLTPIRCYEAGRVAELGETHSGAINSGTAQIPPHIAYSMSAGNPPSLSTRIWGINGTAYDCTGMAIESVTINLPVTSQSTTESPSIEFAMVGEFHAKATISSPELPVAIAPPPFRDGKFAIKHLDLGMQSLSLTINATVNSLANPNRPTGSEASIITSTQRQIELDINHPPLATIDHITDLTEAVEKHPVMAVWGSNMGNMFTLMIRNTHFNYFSPSEREGFAALRGTGYIDDVDRSIVFTIPWSTFA